MHKFETGKEYAITKFGRISHEDFIRVIKRTNSFVTFERVFKGHTSIDEPERNKIILTENGNEMLIIFGGLISDSVYAKDLT